MKQKAPIETVAFDGQSLRLIDQTLLPGRLEYVVINDWKDAVTAISTMVVRGAPAIGCTAAAGMALAAKGLASDIPDDLMEGLERAATAFRSSRPTAVNLFWAVDRMLGVARANLHGAHAMRTALGDAAQQILRDDVECCRALGRFGADLLPADANVLTHCNAGALCAAGYGTALGVVRAAVEQGKRVHVYADETRPRLQGMRLTAWELNHDEIPVTVIADGMAAVLLREGAITCVVVGADRIAANGDAANKIGTYGLAVQAAYHFVPFYIAAPMSTVDYAVSAGSGIPIEERSHTEVTHLEGIRIAPEGVPVWNPSFDVTPAKLITAIITERGVVHSPDTDKLLALKTVEPQNE